MTLLLPRLPRPEVDALLDRLLELDLDQIARQMPVEGLAFTYAPTGGATADPGFLAALRERVLELASAAGYPQRREQSALRDFDAECARLLHEELPVTPHEAAHREVWACLTTAHLLDVATWRWGTVADRNRVNGDLNRDTFRRLWWRAEILHDPATSWDHFGGLGEDEIVAIMERPGVTGNPRIARAVVRGFLARLEADPSLTPQRMQLMRDGMKRLTRLTPFTALDALSDDALALTVESVMLQASFAVSPELQRG